MKSISLEPVLWICYSNLDRHSFAISMPAGDPFIGETTLLTNITFRLDRC